MIIRYVKLNNFRQYYGENLIEFAANESNQKNITVIHGENGSGKTALLSGITWCLYDEKELNLPNPQDICNQYSVYQATIGEKIESTVEIEFEDQNYIYNIKKTINAIKEDEDDVRYYEPEVELYYFDEDGNAKDIANYTEEINSIIPSNLKKYFFFDGERIDRLASEEGVDDIQEAIKIIMNINVLERANRHIEDAKKRFASELRNIGDEETSQIYEEAERIDRDLEGVNEVLTNKENTINELKKEMNKIDQTLAERKESEQKQREREQKQLELQRLKDANKDKESSIRSTLSSFGYLILGLPAINQAKEYSEGESIENKKEKMFSASSIQYLLDENKCVCGQDISEHNEFREHLEEFLSLLKEKNFSNLIQLREDVGTLREKRLNVIEELKRLKVESKENKEAIEKLEEQIQQISGDLSSSENEKVKDLETKRQQLRTDIDELIAESGAKEREKENLQKAKNENEKKKQRIEIKESKVKVAKKREDACQRIADTLSDLIGMKEENVKEDLQVKISNTFDQFLRKGYKVKITDDYRLKVLNQLDHEVALSQGERQVTGLSFISSLVDYARDKDRSNNDTALEDGGVYPIMVDSPFGNLDPDHRARIANGLWQMANQLIVVVSTSQWRGEVENKMSEAVGKEYVLHYNDPDANGNDQFEFTIVEEV